MQGLEGQGGLRGRRGVAREALVPPLVDRQGPSKITVVHQRTHLIHLPLFGFEDEGDYFQVALLGDIPDFVPDFARHFLQDRSELLFSHGHGGLAGQLVEGRAEGSLDLGGGEEGRGGGEGFVGHLFGKGLGDGAVDALDVRLFQLALLALPGGEDDGEGGETGGCGWVLGRVGREREGVCE
jgi:hypothetical protein